MEASLTALLASVADLDEAAMALAGGADILDLKDPARGALGAWPTAAIARAVARFAGLRPLSATIGDLPLEPETVCRRVRAVAATGVDIIKIGIFAGDLAATLAALAPLAQSRRLVAVMFADRVPPLSQLADFAAAGFFGVMLDTADKRAGGLRRHLDPTTLAAFIAQARQLRLGVGLAGSLQLEDIAPLAALSPDWLGFRGALCSGGRSDRLDPNRLAAVRAALATALRQGQAGDGQSWRHDRRGTAAFAVKA
jgi:uncharacterized protein (UPF0264 family)